MDPKSGSKTTAHNDYQKVGFLLRFLSVYLGRITPKTAWEHKTGHIRRIKSPFSLIFGHPQQINKV